MPASPSTALLLVNLGTPDAPTPRAVRRYLAEFLSDRRIVQLARWLWWPLLHGVILPLRASKVARKYASIWMPDGSPLAVHTRALAVALQALLPQWRVLPAMRYGQPALAEALGQLREEGVRRVVVLPLYPQYSTTTTESVADALAQAGAGFELHMIDDYSVDPGWVAAVADSIRAHRTANGDPRHLLFSFHGLPQRIADAGDPYPQRCEGSARAIAASLGLADDAWSLAYQSRFGRERWLRPSTIDVLDDLAARDIATVDVVCPGFAVDCLETLEEVAMMLAERFAQRGGQLRYIPCLNAGAAHAQALAALASRQREDAHA